MTRFYIQENRLNDLCRYWRLYASLVPADPDHARAVQWLAENHSPLLTTDYVIDETLTLLRVRGEKKRALLLGARFFHHDLAEIHKITIADLTLAWKVFEEFDDKNWSFTDCTSKVVMEQLGIEVALPSITTSTNSEQFELCRKANGRSSTWTRV